jgi:histone deacetylase 1/2
MHQEIKRGTTQDELYLIGTPKNNGRARVWVFSTAKPSLDIWHCRLGHPNNQHTLSIFKIKNLSISNSSLDICNACCLGKLHKLPSIGTFTDDETPLLVIYSDIWGPNVTASNQWHRYYIIFIDGHSRYTWFFPLDFKSEALSTFVKF